ncbi:methylated-DNA--[protein]-cysteine S-methyltransferase [Paenibacillus alkaliterrae]|uniref:methylated-DNA--[protein]-cysteine S-methyltransferase n=1 Tax=Paenibacillus alkaliterrae TaxID=320909 RepID=UPI001F2FB12F|nr:methylated-DNA--[protein]-cysteine S-methyltransferase [Paenibacillus alkaliterrae]MCF2937766.1 methylated-DNA--[protein]-cysteine S-methyltransferase [Paenibacillus alkaliterrae]
MEVKNNPTIYWSLLTHEDWRMYVAATSQGLCYVGSQNKPFAELAEWGQNRFPGSDWIQNDEQLQPYEAELIEYLQGKRQNFTVPFDFRGTTFQLAVWNALCRIPYGQTQSYSDIAEHVQRPSAVRAVGAAIGANPVLITVPCHRVIGKNGSLTGYRGGLDMKTKLLRLEQVGTSNEGSPVHAS